MTTYPEHPGVDFGNDGTCAVIRRSPFSGKLHAMRVAATRAQFDAWNGGKMVQDAFPTLNADEREFIKTGITPQEWKDAFGDEA